VPTLVNTEYAPAHRRSFMNSDSNMSLVALTPLGFNSLKLVGRISGA
jgi:hypothetical protein